VVTPWFRHDRMGRRSLTSRPVSGSRSQP
jgi:hypothetical protein